MTKDGSARKSLAETLSETGVSGLVRRIHAGLIYRYHERFNARFDARYKIDTRTSVALETLDFEHPNKTHAVDYEPTPTRLVADLLRTSTADRASSTFIDLGCGKGRVLVKAAERGFNTLVGVEFAEEIASQAEANLASVFAYDPELTWQVLAQDASLFRAPDTDLVIFLYNPFGAPVLEKVADWIEAHIARGFTVEVIYYNAQCRSVFDKRRCLTAKPYSRALKLKLALLSWHKAVSYVSVSGGGE